jgi:hypothetical protein
LPIVDGGKAVFDGDASAQDRPALWGSSSLAKLNEEGFLRMKSDASTAVWSGSCAELALRADEALVGRKVCDGAGASFDADALRAANRAAVEVDLEVGLGEAPGVVKRKWFAEDLCPLLASLFDRLVAEVGLTFWTRRWSVRCCALRIQAWTRRVFHPCQTPFPFGRSGHSNYPCFHLPQPSVARLQP